MMKDMEADFENSLIVLNDEDSKYCEETSFDPSLLRK
jgi:hypothetical protein